MPEQRHFEVRYDGAYLSDGVMDVSELAPALLGLNDVFDELADVATEGRSGVKLRVRAEFRRGSFGIDLEAVQQAYGQFIEFMNSKGPVAWSTFFGLLAGVGGLIPLIRKSKGKKPKTIVEYERSERFRVTFEDGEESDVQGSVWKLFNSPKARSGLARFVRPVSATGIDSVEVHGPGVGLEKITKSEVPYFKVMPQHEGELITETEKVVRLIGVYFHGANKWRVTDGSTKYVVSIADEAFAQAVARGTERFGASDQFKVLLRTRQWYEGDDLKSSHEIAKMIKRINAPSQRGLPFDEGNGPKGVA